VRFPLVDARVGDVHLEREDIGDLHRRVDHLGEIDGLPFPAAQDRDAALHAGERRVLADVDECRPVVVVVVVEVSAEDEGELRGVAAERPKRCLQPLGEVVVGDAADAVPVAAKLVVDPGVPVGEEDGALDARIDEILDLAHADETRAKMDLTGDLEADVVAQGRVRADEALEVLPGEHFLEVARDQRYGVGHRASERGYTSLPEGRPTAAVS